MSDKAELLVRKLLLFVFAVNIIFLAFANYQIIIYQMLTPKLIWAVNTLQIDFAAQRDLYLSCKNKMVPM